MTISGYFKNADFSLIEIYGPEAQQFLQAQTTNDVKALAPHCSQKSALLDRKAHIVAYFTLFRKNTSYRIVSQCSQADYIVEHLERFHFADKVEFFKLSGSFFGLAGSEARLILGSVMPGSEALFKDQDLIDGELFDAHVHVFRLALGLSETFLIYCDKEHVENLTARLVAKCQEHMLTELTSQDLLADRVEAGIASYGIDFDSNNLIFELGLEDGAISYTKGCFQGQEVLARVKAQGSPAKQLSGLSFDQDPGEIKIATKLSIDDQEAITVLSNVFSKTLNKRIALAMVKREFRKPGTLTATLANKPLALNIVVLPFIENKPAREAEQRACDLYSKALQEFAEDRSSQAIANLRQALLLDPYFQDAYEALGVMLSKQGEIDEAIELMQALLRLNSDSIMAWANLSVFYLEKGDKDKAEEAKAESMSIRMKLAAREAMQEKKAKEDASKLEAETKERMGMFAQVLEIDPDDLFANHGLGACHNILKNFEEAEKYLLKAIAVKPNHTVAYQELGTAYEGLNRMDKAKETYLKGIEIAAQKGDMTPLKAMQARLDSINAMKLNV